jgi:endonuclease/exonuclease/phosphatase family metal-dependent hydrolase
LNIEGPKNLDRILPFLEREAPDVFCTQELFQSDIDRISGLFSEKIVFEPMAIYGRGGFVSDGEKGQGEQGPMGLGIFSNLPVRSSQKTYFYGDPRTLPIHLATDMNTLNRLVVSAKLEKEGVIFNVATTHFTRSKDGGIDEVQRHDLPKLLQILGKLDGFVLAGDFNAPRGGEVFDTIAARYKDNIPKKYVSSLDPELHRIGQLDIKFMVDGLFTTPGYVAEDVRLVDGLSDHMAIVSYIRKT